MISNKTKSLLTGMLEQKIKNCNETIEHNQAQFELYKTSLEAQKAITHLSAGFRVKEEFNSGTSATMLRVHQEAISKHEKLLADYQDAYMELSN